jgi:tRNA 2-thiouridine synthesizing protein E
VQAPGACEKESDMITETIAGKEVHLNEEGFMTEYDEWTEEIGAELASLIGVEMTDEHWRLIRWLRRDFQERGETATTRRVQTAGGVPTKKQFEMFPKKPAKKMSYIAGLPKPKGCV